MLHQNKDEFLKILERTSAQTQFPLRLLEKDYYLTIALSKINSLSSNLVFKGGTCLNKIYYSYYRLSEDMDFTLILPSNKATRTERRRAIEPIKKSISNFAENLDMKAENIENTGHNESRQYIYYLAYPSVILNKSETIKLEIGLRFNPLMPVEEQKIQHKFLHPFTKEPLFDAGKIKCLNLKEQVAEKMRAAATREIIAARDFYDLGFLLKNKYDFKDKELLMIFKKKLLEDKRSDRLKQYSINFGRSDEEIDEMKKGVADELFPVLTINEQKNFDISKTLNEFNNILLKLK